MLPDSLTKIFSCVLIFEQFELCAISESCLHHLIMILVPRITSSFKIQLYFRSEPINAVNMSDVL
jgi:hypothetical protein